MCNQMSKRNSNLESKVSFKVYIPEIQLAVCLDRECSYYKKSRKHYTWYSNSHMEKPSCPKCNGHNTIILFKAKPIIDQISNAN